MARIPSPTEAPELWDSCEIGGVRVPGVVRVSGGHARREDTEEVPGQDGVTTTILGYQPAEFTLDVLLWGDTDYTSYLEFYRRFRPRKSDPKVAEALTVAQNAAFMLADVSQLTIYELTVPRWQHDQQYSAQIRMREFIPETTRSKGTKASPTNKATAVQPQGPDRNVSLVSGTQPSESRAAIRFKRFASPDSSPGLIDSYPVENL